MEIQIEVANESHLGFALPICELIEESAKNRGTGIAKRDPKYIKQKIMEGKAVIAFQHEEFVGFCYIESWQNKAFVANSGLIVHPDYRGKGVAKQIKVKAFQLSRTLFPESKMFSITTNNQVMKLNSELGYQPVAFAELTHDETFWKGCNGCSNVDILNRTKRTMCLCTAMLFEPK